MVKELNMEKQTEIDILIIRLLAGEASPQEKQLVGQWLEESEENKALYNELTDIWLSSGVADNTDNYDVEEAVNRFREKIRQTAGSKIKRIKFFEVLKYAAVILLFLGLPVSYYFGTQSISSDQTMTTISCAYGDRSSVVLPDSSRVWLNSGSKLTFNSNFTNDRKVELVGEAFFSVSKDKSHPFVVKAADINIKVLGTEFNVKAYADENIVSTTLIKGAVEVNSKNEITSLKPDQRLTFDKSSQNIQVQDLANTSIDTEWREGRFVFNNESLAELKPKLERWFDCDIVFGDKDVQSRRFTGVLQRESILEAISYFDLSNYVTCKIEGNKIIINSQK